MKKTTNLALALTALLCASRGFALPVEITIADNEPTYNGFVGDGSTTSNGTFTAGLGIAKEDNEVERTAKPGGGYLSSIAGQAWDLEGMFRSGNSLYLVGGYDFLNGLVSGRPGDLFIKVGGPKPTGTPLTNTSNVANSLYNYTYAVDLSTTNFLSQLGAASYVNAASFGATTSVFDLKSTSTLNTATNDLFGSNPWRYQNNYAKQPGISTAFTNTNDGVLSTSLSYYSGLTSAQVNTMLGATFAGSTHNVLQIDLSFLGTIAPNTDIWYSYTMECGNDSLKGYEHVPDGGASAILIGLGLGAVALASRKRRTA